MAERLHLDHTGHVVRDLAAAAALFRRLGFQLLPVSHHRTPDAQGQMVPAGTANQCAMLAQGYLELLTVTDPQAPSYSARENAAFLQRFEGLHLLAIGTRDAQETQRRLGAAPVAFSERRLGRVVETPAGPAEARFHLMPVSELSGPNQSFFLIEHQTRALVWPEGSTQHENGARRLGELLLVAEDPAGLAEVLDRTLGCRGVAGADGRVWQLDASALIVATPAEAATRLGVPVARREGFYAAAQVVEVDDLARVEALLRRNEVRFRRHGARLTVAADTGFGVVLQFSEGPG